MPFDVSGNFTRAYNWVQDRDNGLKIQAARMDGEFDGIATALNQTLLRNGAAAMSANLKMGNFSLTQLANGSAGTPSISFNTEANTGAYLVSAGNFGFSVQGTQRLLLTTTGLSTFGKFTTAASASGGAGFNLPTGAAPSAPVDGDVWVTNQGLFAQIAGSTNGPFAYGPTISGGRAANSVLTLQSTTVAGTTDAVIINTGSQVQAAKWETGGSLALGPLAPVATTQLLSSKNPTGAVSTIGIQSAGTIQSGVTTSHTVFSSNPSTQAAAGFNLTTLTHFSAAVNSVGAGSAIINQYGHYVGSGFTNAGAANHGFRSDLAVNGTINWSCYMAGTAPNYFNGYVTIGTNTQVGSAALTVNGSALVVSATGILGYSTGAGGAVTQTTSRTTAVTLNKPTGAITLVSAAGSAAYQSFTVNNALVTALDTISLSQKSGTDKYILLVTNVAAGSFQITYATTGGTTTEQPVFNFNVVRGAVT